MLLVDSQQQGPDLRVIVRLKIEIGSGLVVLQGDPKELAQQVGRSQSSVANKLRLLNLSPVVQQAIAEKAITERHGRAMLNLNEQQQQTVLEEIIKKNLTVKQTETFIKKLGEEEEDDDFSIRCFGVSTRIAVNTIMQAVKSLRDVNMPIEVNHQDNPDEYVMTITIKK